MGNQAGDVSLVKTNILEKTLKTTVNGQGLRPCVNMPGKSPQADRSGLYNQRHQPNKRVSPCPPKHNVIF